MTDPPRPGSQELAGVVLAAGAGRRMGRPKALLTDADGTPFVDVAADRLLSAGCASVTVVLGAEQARVRELLRARPGTDVRIVVADDWGEGMGASLRNALGSLHPAAAALVTLVDLPDVDVDVMRRVVDRWRAAGGGPDALVRATYHGRPGHPVLIGHDHWAPLWATLAGDSGARGYLSRRIVHEVSCEDLATGRDLDRPEDLV